MLERERQLKPHTAAPILTVAVRGGAVAIGQTIEMQRIEGDALRQLAIEVVQRLYGARIAAALDAAHDHGPPGAIDPREAQ